MLALLTLSLAPAAHADVLAGPVSTDVFDITQGNVVTNSDMPFGPANENAVFSLTSGIAPVELGSAFFADGPAGSTSFIEFQTAGDVVLDGVRLFASSDGPLVTTFIRAMRDFRLLADVDNNGSFETTVIDYPNIGPNYLSVPGNALLISNPTLTNFNGLDLTIPLSTPVVARRWRMEVTNWFAGPYPPSNVRIYELDAIGHFVNGVSTLCANPATATIVGTDGDDYLLGTPGDDIIFGLGGNDLIDGMGGNDILCGGPGVDNVLGRAGNDVVDGGSGYNFLRGGDGDDTVYGGGDGNEIQGNAGMDLLYGGASVDTIYGGDGSDEIHAGDGNDYVLGMAGDDAILGEGGNDWIGGGDGDDCIDGGDGNDLMHGNDGDDCVDGGDGIDQTDCGSGNDSYASGEYGFGSCEMAGSCNCCGICAP